MEYTYTHYDTFLHCCFLELSSMFKDKDEVTVYYSRNEIEDRLLFNIALQYCSITGKSLNAICSQFDWFVLKFRTRTVTTPLTHVRTAEKIAVSTVIFNKICTICKFEDYSSMINGIFKAYYRGNK